jgi:hypothetical protein
VETLSRGCPSRLCTNGETTQNEAAIEQEQKCGKEREKEQKKKDNE